MNSDVIFNPAAISGSTLMGFLEGAAEIMLIGLSGLFAAALFVVIWLCLFEPKNPCR